MNTKVTFLEPKKVLVETPQGDNFVVSFQSEMNYQMGLQANIPFTECLAFLFDKHYNGDDSVIFGPISLGLMKYGFDSIFSFQRDKFKERVKFGERIKELRVSKGIDAKTLAEKAEIDPANLCRIEQGKYSPGFDIISKIAYAMGMKLDFVELDNKEE